MRQATSGLAENLTYGEISPRTIWHAGRAALHEGAVGAEHFLKELVWREFAYHLMYHTPARSWTGNWRAGWDGFPWRADNADADALAARSDRHRDRRCGHARDVCHRHHAQPHRGCWWQVLPDQAPDDALAHRHQLVPRLPDRLGPGLERDGLAVDGRVRGPTPRPTSGSSTRISQAREVRCRTAPIATGFLPCNAEGAARDYRPCRSPRSWGLSTPTSRAPTRYVDLRHTGRKRALAADGQMKAR